MTAGTLTLRQQLELSRCPHCGVDSPNLAQAHIFETTSANHRNKRVWAIYVCRRCGGAVSAFAANAGAQVGGYYPSVPTVDEVIPDRARAYLQQALESIHVPAGAVMLAASAVDAMLKAKGLTSGTLYSRIDQAAQNGVITQDMAKWAHHVRLDANDQRHSDENASMPAEADAVRCVEFASALAQFMFILPARVQRGLASTS